MPIITSDQLTPIALSTDQALVIAESGTYRGVDWSIVPEHVRRPGFALSVAGRYVATTGSRMAADALRKEWIDDLWEQGLVNTADGSHAG